MEGHEGGHWVAKSSWQFKRVGMKRRNTEITVQGAATKTRAVLLFLLTNVFLLCIGKLGNFLRLKSRAPAALLMMLARQKQDAASGAQNRGKAAKSRK